MKYLKKIFFYTNVLAALSLIAGCASMYIDPSEAWVFSFFGLAYPAFLILNIFFFFLWIIVRLRYSLVSAVAILLTIPVLKCYFSFGGIRNEYPQGAGMLKVMTYNVRNFDLYQWSKIKNARADIVDVIKHEHPAIACFQEFYNADTGSYQMIRVLAEQAGLKYSHFDKTYTGKGERSWGIAILSRYPIINHGNIQFDNRTQNACCYVDVRIAAEIVRVYNIHLQSVYLSKKDYEYLEDISENQDVQVGPSREIISKLKRAFVLRGKQALRINEEIKKSPHPVIICGDFNDTPASFAYHTISENLHDTFLKAGWGVGATYSGFFKAYRIDYILADDNFKISSYQTIRNSYSDHFAVVSDVQLVK